MQNDINIKEFNEVPDFEDTVALVRGKYREYRTLFPFNKGKVLENAFNKIVNSVYQKFLPFSGFTSSFSSLEEFKGFVSTKLNKKKETIEIKEIETNISKDVVGEIHWPSFWQNW